MYGVVESRSRALTAQHRLQLRQNYAEILPKNRIVQTLPLSS